ncbi:anti-sigma factor family protein [Frigidibacter sp. MR17.24]|uniref:anti-sigma factor family protein n=1 Tax=Frigidibacter sp. MR17.24 TaxID=3127345 RepID=UPI003012D141
MSGGDRDRIGDLALIALRHGRLSAAEARALQARVDRDPAALAVLADWDAQDDALAALYDPVAAEPLPPAMTAALEAARRAEAPLRAPARPQPAPAPRRALSGLRRIAASVALLGLGAAGGWGAAVTMRPGGAPAPMSVSTAAMRAHEAFAVEPIRAVEVTGDNRPQLESWLSKRLGHEIAAPDLGALGFRLMGGRIVPMDQGPMDSVAAMFIYEDDAGHRATLYVAPQPAGTETAFRFVDKEGMQGFWWIDRGMGYAVVGTFPRSVIENLASAVHSQLG